MDILLIIKLAIRGLLLNKIRAFLTVLGIIIGVSGIIVIVSIGNGAESLIVNQLQSIGTNLVGVLPGGGEEGQPPAALFGIVITTLKNEDFNALKEIPHVVDATAYNKSVENIVYGNKKTETTITGTFASYPVVKDAVIEEGRYFTESEDNNLAKVVVLGSDIKKELFGESNPIGQRVKIRNQSYKVIGYMKEMGITGFTNNDIQIFIPIKTMQKLILGINHVGFGQVKVDNEENIQFVIGEIKQVLRTRHQIENPKDDDFTVNSLQQGLNTLQNVTGSIKLFLTAIAGVALIVGGIGIMNVMYVAVRERTHEIGLRKAIGANNRDILKQFLIEAITITGIGGIIGIILGLSFSFLVAFIIQQLGYSWDFIVTLNSIFYATGVIVLIGIVFGYAPAKKAALLQAIEAMRYE